MLEAGICHLAVNLINDEKSDKKSKVLHNCEFIICMSWSTNTLRRGWFLFRGH